MSDLYGSSGNAIAMGNARNAAVRDHNDRVQAHNSDVANQISGLRDQAKSAETIVGLKNAGQALWTAKGMPDKIASYSKWKQAKSAGGGKANPTANTEADQRSAAETSSSTTTADATAGSSAAPSTESQPPTAELTGADQATESVDVVGARGEGEAGSQVSKGLSKATEGAAEGFGERAAKGATVFGAAAMAGIDIDQDVKAGGIAGNNNWEKAGNVLQIGGAIADVGGLVFPPLELLGGVLDLASAATTEIGDYEDAGKTSSDITAQGKAETVAPEAAPAQITQVTGRTQ